MNEIKLSICVPTYNRGEILKKTLEGITSQNLDNIEIVISDNASEDETLKIVSDFQSLGVKYFRNNQNYGAVYNIIKALELGSGEYVVLSSDEDIPALNNIISILDLYESIRAGFVSGLYEYTIDHKSSKPIVSREDRILEPGPDALAERGYKNNYIFSGAFRRSSIDFDDLWYQYSLNNFGFLNMYPHQYIINQLLMRDYSISCNVVFCTQGDVRGPDFMEHYAGGSFKTPLSRFHEFLTKIDYLDYILKKNHSQKFSLTKRVYNNFIGNIYNHRKFANSSANLEFYKIEKTSLYSLTGLLLRATLHIYLRAPKYNIIILKYIVMSLYLNLKYLLYPILSPIKRNLMFIK